ncbi:MAG: oxidoreductase [Acidimicrobiales bacterium]|jgi:NAD(P)-dependent dehydrogenase (short-subunit alcohol dehydrogenase family)|nr:oxidoreductase [Acidimicrobiales bacterium]
MAKWSESDIPDQSGRVALITGANSGLGYETARALAQNGARVVMACRNPEKAAGAEAQINETNPSGSVEVLLTDMADLDSIAGSVAQFTAEHDTLDLLINNAGIMATPLGQTAQGFEQQLGVNHLGHFALTAPLLPLLFAAGDGSRVVSVSSNAHKFGTMNFDDLMSTKKYSPWGAYGQSKLANLLFTSELQRRLDAGGHATIAVTAHPGGSRTELGKESAGGTLSTMFSVMRPLMNATMSQSAAMGALPQLYAAVALDVQGDDYYGPEGLGELRGHPEKVGRTSKAKSVEDAGRLWDVSGELTGITYNALG